MTIPVRIGIVGTGFGARFHLPAFQSLPGAAVVALADSGSGRAVEVAPAGIRATDWRTLVAASDVDAIVVALPPFAHRAVVEAALASGKHVLCEKPFGLHAPDAEAMTEAASRAGRIGAIGFQFRYEPHLMALRAALHDGAIGRQQQLDLKWLHGARASADFPWSWQNDAGAGGGLANALASHVVDLFVWLADSAIATVESSRTAILVPRRKDQGGTPRIVTAEDWVEARLRLANGSSAGFEVSNCMPGGQGMEIMVIGEKGLLRCGQRPPFRSEDAFLVLEKSDGTALPLPIPRPPGNASPDTRLLAVQALGQDFLGMVVGQTSHVPNFEAGLAMRRILDRIAGEAIASRKK